VSRKSGGVRIKRDHLVLNNGTTCDAAFRQNFLITSLNYDRPPSWILKSLKFHVSPGVRVGFCGTAIMIIITPNLIAVAFKGLGLSLVTGCRGPGLGLDLEAKVFTEFMARLLKILESRLDTA